MFYFEFFVNTCDRFSDFDNNIMLFDQTRFYPEFNEMVASGKSLGMDRQSLNLSLWLN